MSLSRPLFPQKKTSRVCNSGFPWTKKAEGSNRDPFVDLLPNLPGQQLHALALVPDGLIFGLRKLLCRALKTA
jgi:hypothetical protein